VSTVPGHLRGLVDDAAVFPPGNAPLDAALRAHLEHRSADHADLVGPFVVADAMLSDLTPIIRDVLAAPAPAAPQDRHGLPVAVVVSGGAGALEPAVRWATRGDHLELRGLEIAMRESDAGDLAPNARRIVAAVDALVSVGELDDEVPVYVEPPPLHGAEPSASWLGALDEIAARDHRLKLRTGGADADAFPSSAELASCIGAALDRELAFKCTAGLHHAVRHRDPETGFEHHGFLNVLLATRASLDGGGPDVVTAVLEERDAGALLGGADDAGLAGARRWFTSFGSCSVLQPLEDLRDLGMVPR
jgi:hypothetical protein